MISIFLELLGSTILSVGLVWGFVFSLAITLLTHHYRKLKSFLIVHK